IMIIMVIARGLLIFFHSGKPGNGTRFPRARGAGLLSDGGTGYLAGLFLSGLVARSGWASSGLQKPRSLAGAVSTLGRMALGYGRSQRVLGRRDRLLGHASTDGGRAPFAVAAAGGTFSAAIAWLGRW